MWKLEAWFGYNGWLDDDHHKPAIDEDFETKAEGVTRAQVILADGYTETIGDVYHHFPAASISHVRLGEYEPEEEE